MSLGVQGKISSWLGNDVRRSCVEKGLGKGSALFSGVEHKCRVIIAKRGNIGIPFARAINIVAICFCWGFAV